MVAFFLKQQQTWCVMVYVIWYIILKSIRSEEKA